MPTILREGGFRLFFYSNEGNEPPHVHVQSGENVAKNRLAPIHPAESRGFGSHEPGQLRRPVNANRDPLLERWHEFFGDST
jgi:hypothetical protein